MNWENLQDVLPDIPRGFTAIAEWLACLLSIFEMKRRFSGWKLAGISAMFLAGLEILLVLTKSLQGFWWILCMGAAVGVMYLFLYLCCEANAMDVGYYCVRAFAVAEFAASLEWQVDCFFRFSLGWESGWFRIFWLTAVYLAVYSAVWLLFRRHARSGRELMVTKRELLSYVMIGLAIFGISNVGFMPWSTPFSGRYMAEIFNVRTLIDFGGLAILYAYHAQRMELWARHELESMESILHSQYAQYKQSQEVIDLINYKYHDLKHHIHALRAEENAQERNAYLDRMEEEIKNYEAQNKTGNQVLDTVLTSKQLYCMKNSITMTCVADGSLFHFMDVMDICSIFGNALDNAIEYEKKIPDQEKRLIHVTAFSQKNFLIVRFENYCEDRLDFKEDLPVTTKKDEHFHGYGLKSLRYTVHKYGGEVDVVNQDNWFHLNILIPIKNERAESK